jgi:hypothetical protein
MNTQFPFMLQDKAMFNIDESEIASTTSNLAAYSIPFTMLSLCLVSYAFELLGRRLTISLSYFLTSIFYYLIPRCAPSYKKLLVIRCLIAVTMAGPIAHPLVADYVHVNSRGKMVVMCGIGIIVGEISAISVFKVQNEYDQDFHQSFTQVSAAIMLLSVYFFFSIKDPDMAKLHQRVG